MFLINLKQYLKNLHWLGWRSCFNISSNICLLFLSTLCVASTIELFNRIYYTILCFGFLSSHTIISNIFFRYHIQIVQRWRRYINVFCFNSWCLWYTFSNILPLIFSLVMDIPISLFVDVRATALWLLSLVIGNITFVCSLNAMLLLSSWWWSNRKRFHFLEWRLPKLFLKPVCFRSKDISLYEYS